MDRTRKNPDRSSVVVADTNFNRGVDPREFRAAALDRFAALDKNHDGRITRSELPNLIAPIDDRFGGRGGRPPRPADAGEPDDDSDR